MSCSRCDAFEYEWYQGKRLGYGLNRLAVPEVRYDFAHSTLCVGVGWHLDVGYAGDFRAVRNLTGCTQPQRDAAYAWYYDSAPTGPDGGRVRFQNSQPHVRL